MLIWLTFLVPGLLLNIGMLTILPRRCRSILIFGLMVAGKIYRFEVAAAGVFLPASDVAFDSSIW